MDFAAASIVNTSAPPARPEAVAADDASSFRDHLAAERAAEARRSPQSERPEEAEADAEDEEQNTDQVVAAPIVLAAPVLVQITVAEPDQTQLPPSGDIEPAPAVPAASAAPPPTPASAPVQQVMLANAAAKDQAKFESRPDAEAATGAPVPQMPPQTVTADAPTAAPVAAPAATPSQQASAPPLTQATQPNADALAALQVNAQPAAKAQANKANGEAAPKIEGAPEVDSATRGPPQVEPTRSQDRAANAQNSAQSKSVETTFLTAQEAPAPTQAPSAPSSHASTQVLQSSVEQSAVRAAPAAAQVGREIIRRFSGHNTQFELRLDPPELGRVDVRLEVSRDHRVTATISADTPQALAEMARHARELEQSLQSAGLELADNGLSFDLRRGSGEDRETTDESGGGLASTPTLEGEMQAAAPRARPVGLERWRGVRVDVMA